MSRLADDILKFLQGEPPRTFVEIREALDFEGTNGELRACLEQLGQEAKILSGRCSDGFTRYSLTQFKRAAEKAAPKKSPAPSQPEAQSTDVAGAPVAVSEIRPDSILGQVAALFHGRNEYLTVRDLVFYSNGEITVLQVTRALQQLRQKGVTEMIGRRASARWRLLSSPGPQGTAEHACTGVGAAVAGPEPSSSTAPALADPPQAGPAPSRALSPLPHRLLARIESVAVDIQDLTNEALDAGLGAGAIKSLVAAGGELRRALLPFNLRN